MILPAISWWFISTLLALVAFPITWRIFSRLNDHGYGFTRILGILFCGYGYWLGTSLQILPNSYGGIGIVFLLLAILAVASLRGIRLEIHSWLRQSKATVFVMELTFLVAFVGWAWVRANNPEITGTEKPMELAFINSILRSEGFPPRDPWLAGYAISYYYFGYVLLSMLTILSGVSAGVAFNLGNSLWFGMVAVGSYSILYNLINRNQAAKKRYIPALLGPLVSLISGNMGGFLELLHSRHLFWRADSSGVLSSQFWSWLGLEDLERAPIGSPSWVPQRYLWWWRSSRVIRDLDLTGAPIGTQSIDEFPFFSFLLADNHPHLLALPVVLIALTFALQLYLSSVRGDLSLPARLLPSIRMERRLAILIGVLLAGNIILALISTGPEYEIATLLFNVMKWFLIEGVILLGTYLLRFLVRQPNRLPLTSLELFFGGWLFGGLAFLNTWDFLPYLVVVVLVIFWRARQSGFVQSIWVSLVTFVYVVFIGGFLYLPWYPTFASQAGGILPHMLHPTRFVHFVIMFAPTLVPISIWLVSRMLQGWSGKDWRWLLGIMLGVPLILQLLSWSLAAVILVSNSAGLSVESILGTLGVNSLDEMIRLTLQIRMTRSWTGLTLGAILAMCVVIMRRNWKRDSSDEPAGMVLFLILVGALLIIGPEYLYLRDQFGLRMNTIFKFYFAAWILWSLASAYILLQLWKQRSIEWLPVKLIALVPLLLGLVYPVLSVWTKTQGFQPHYGRSLDGSLHPAYMNPDDREAIQWINQFLDDGVIAEAVGGSYTYYTRVSTHTGLPTVLGWPGHEGQWRGGYLEQGSRLDDVRQLYQAQDWPSTLEILNRYQIDYVYVGSLERQTYRPVFEAKFDAFMNLIYANETVQIYARELGGSS